MYEFQKMLFIWCEQDFFPGGEREVSAVDLRVQRDSATGIPICRGSSLKGALRSFVEHLNKHHNANICIDELFGPEITTSGPKHAGALEFLNAGILLYPIQSYVGLFVYITSPYQLEEYWLKHLGSDADNLISVLRSLSNELNGMKAIIPKNSILSDQDIILYHGEFIIKQNEYRADDSFGELLEKLAEQALPKKNNNILAGYSYIKTKILESTILIKDDDFRRWVERSLPRITRIALDYDTKTVRRGALFIQELIPRHTLMASAMYKAHRYQNQNKIDNFLRFLKGIPLINIGGSETVGYGMIRLVIYP